jgi:hypothetical protein
MTEFAFSARAEAVAQIREQLAAGAPCILISGHGGVGKSAILKALLREPDLLFSRRSVKRGVAELDRLQSDLEEDRGDGHIIVYDPAGEVSTEYAIQIKAPTASVAAPADAAKHPWSPAVGSLSGAEAHNVSSSLTFDEYLAAHLRQELLRLVNRMRMVLRLRLIYILSGLCRIPETVNFVLLLLAATRCYGRRTEPSACTLPVLASMSVVIGETACLR